MSGDPLRGNWHVVNSLRSALHKGEHGLSTVPGLLKRVLAEESWREFVTERGEHVHHERFAEFVTAPPMKGIGATVDLVKRVVSDDPEAVDLLDRALQNPAGRPETLSNIQDKAPTGTTKDRALRKLRADAPELHAEVLAGNLTAHKAMVQAGFRPRTFTVRPDPASAARTLRKYLTAEQRAELARLLADEEGM